MWLYIYIWVYMVIWIYLIIKGLLSCLRRVCQGSTNVSFQRSVLCVQERVQKRFLHFFPGNGAEETFLSKLHAYHRCSENLMRFWNLLIDRPGLVKKSENLVKTWWISKNLVNCWLFWKRGGNLVKTWWICKTEQWMPKPGENLVKTRWKVGEFIRFSPNERKTRFTHWRILIKRLLHPTPEIV